MLSGLNGQVYAATMRACKSGRARTAVSKSFKHLYPLEVSAENGSEPTEIVSRHRREATEAEESSRLEA